MTRFAAAVILLQALIVMGAVIAGGIDIESILFSGPLASIVGLVSAALAYRSGRVIGLYFGLTPPAISLAVCTWISTMRWGPSSAQRPVFTLLLLIALPLLAAAYQAWRELQSAAKSPPQRLRFQFSVATLLVTTTAVAIPFGLGRAGLGAGLAVGLLLGYLLFAGAIAWKFHRQQSTSTNLPVSPESTLEPAGRSGDIERK
ncbi:MAG: hypothetical protein AB7O59_04045 [Pirellulales bacterium]